MTYQPYIPAIGVNAPWWWWIFNGKDIENRTRTWKHHGPLLIYANKTNPGDDAVHNSMLDALDMAVHSDGSWEAIDKYERLGVLLLDSMKVRGGHLVGIVHMSGYCTASKSPWFQGPIGYRLSHPMLFDTPVPWKGKQGVMHVPMATPGLLDQLRNLAQREDFQLNYSSLGVK